MTLSVSFLCVHSKFPSPLAHTAAGLLYVVGAEPLFISEIPEIHGCCTCSCVIKLGSGIPRDGPVGHPGPSCVVAVLPPADEQDQ